MSTEFTVEQVASHKFDKKNSSSLCWIIIHNTVYDVTKFMKEASVPNDCFNSFIRVILFSYSVEHVWHEPRASDLRSLAVFFAPIGYDGYRRYYIYDRY